MTLCDLLIGDDIDDDWIAEEENGSLDVDPEQATESSNSPNYSRRDELYYYLSELQETVIN